MAQAVITILTIALGTFLLNYLGRKGPRAAIAGALAHLAAWVMWAAIKVLPEASRLAAQLFVDTFKLTVDAWAPAVGVLFKELLGADVDIEALRKATPETTLRAMFEPIAGQATRSLLEAMAPTGPVTPETAQQNVTSILGLLIGINISSWWMEFMADASTLSHIRAFVDLRQAIDQSLALQRIGRLMWVAPIRKAITEPLTILYDATYTLKRLSAAELLEGFARGSYTIDQYLSGMREQGYNYTRAIDLANIRQTLLSVTESTELWRRGDIDDPTHLELIKKHGYGEERAAFVLALEQTRVLKSIQDSIATEVRTLWKKGELSNEELRANLSALHYKDFEIDALLTWAAVEQRNESRLTEAQLFDAYREQLLSEADMRARLRSRGFADEDIDILEGLQRRKLSAADTVELYVRGFIPQGEAVARLERSGYSADDAALLLQVRQRSLSQGQVIDALRGGLLNTQDAAAALQRLGFTSEAIDIIIAFAQRRLSAADVQAAVLRGLITPEAALLKLQAVGYSTEDAQLLLELRVRLFTTGETVDLYAAGFLARSDATARLVELGFTADDADLLLRLEERKLAAKATAPGAPAAVTAAKIVRPRRARTAAPPAAP